MLFPELVNDGKPIVKLNLIQRDACLAYNQKLQKGFYIFELPNCIICGKSDFDELGGKDRYGLSYLTVICNSCGLVQSKQRMDSRSVRQFYNDDYPFIYFGTNEPTKAVFDNQYERANLIYRFIKPFLPTGKANSDIEILEVGCNTGGILKHFADRNFKVSGLEINSEAVAFANKYSKQDVIEGSLETVNLKKKPDIIIYSHVLEHLSDPRKELMLISNNLKEGGFLFIEVPGIKNIHKSYHGNLLLYLQNAHVAHFSLVTLRNLLQNSGFEIIAADETISCLCRKSETLSQELKNDKQEVLEYLKKTELIRKKKLFQLRRLLAFPKQFVKSMLKLTGLYNTFFKLYHLR